MKTIWTETEMPAFSPLRGEKRTDVLVIGGGLTGLLCAHALKEAGVSCIVCEAGEIGGGVTRGTTAKVTAQHGLCYEKLRARFGTERAAAYLWANLRAVEQYRELAQKIPCAFSDAPAYVYSRTGTDALEQELRALEAMGYHAEFAKTAELPFPTDGAVKFPAQGQLDPMMLLAGLAKGLEIYSHARIVSLHGTHAATEQGRIFADKIIVATHFPFWNLHGSYFLKLYQQRSYVLALENAPLPAGMYIDAAENGLSFRTAKGTLLLGGGGHRTGKQGGGFAELRAFAAQAYPGAREWGAWAVQDCMSLDGLPYIGRYAAQLGRIFVATGYSKWGFTNAMVAANLLTDLVLGRENGLAEVVSPSRSMLHVQLLKNGGEAVRSLLTPTVPRCPHLGCALKWNPQEHSWDCPCHGSRFTQAGKLLDGPATGGLHEKKRR